MFTATDWVAVTEKIHGANARYVYVEHPWAHKPIIGRFFRNRGKFYVGSRNEWKAHDGHNIWSRAVTPQMESLCREWPGCVLYGEVYGDVQDMKYGCENGQVRFVAFDFYSRKVYVNGYWPWLPFRALMDWHEVPTAPVLYEGEYNRELIESLAEGQSQVCPSVEHIREGVVIRDQLEHEHPGRPRKQLKLVGNAYYERV
jgi:RNA ligase (TIGR02306 family)